MVARAAVSTVTLKNAVGFQDYALDLKQDKMVAKPHEHLSPPPGYDPAQARLDLLDVPAEVAAHGFDCFDLSVLAVRSIERSYLAELRSAFEDAGVELFQLLIDIGEIGSPDPDERANSIKLTKRLIEVASELGAGGIRYVPGYAEPSAENIPSWAEAFRELANYAQQYGLRPATENYKTFNTEPDALLQVIDQSERDYGVIGDFGNAKGPDKYEILGKILPRATSIHAWAFLNDDGTLNHEEFRRCLSIARDSGFDGPIMLHGSYTPDNFCWAPDIWAGVETLRGEFDAVFGKSNGNGS